MADPPLPPSSRRTVDCHRRRKRKLSAIASIDSRAPNISALRRKSNAQSAIRKCCLMEERTSTVERGWRMASFFLSSSSAYFKALCGRLSGEGLKQSHSVDTVSLSTFLSPFCRYRVPFHIPLPFPTTPHLTHSSLPLVIKSRRNS